MVNAPTDDQLLREFAELRDEASFGQLVHRHIHLVHSAALRLALDPQLAQDVSQHVFLALARQAAHVSHKLAKGMPLSAWLHLTTRNLAAKAVRTETRRRVREQAAAAMHVLPAEPAESAWDDIAPHLDNALTELPEPDRHALILRFFEGRTAREIGERLGLSEEAAQKRVTRALERLRLQFTRRGLTVSASGMAVLLGGHAVQAAPTALAGGIAAAVLKSAAAAGASGGVAALLNSFTGICTMTKAQTATTLALLCAVTVPVAVQRATLSRLRAELTAPLPASDQSAQNPPAEVRARETEADEMAKLRREIANLRAQLAVRRAQPKPKASSERVPGPVLLVPGRVAKLDELAYAGNATPQAAFQSLLAAYRDGDLETALALMLEQPSEQEQAMLSSEAGREEAAQTLKSQVQALLSVELLSQQPIAERRVQLLVRETRAARTVTNTVSLGQTSRGWKQIL